MIHKAAASAAPMSLDVPTCGWNSLPEAVAVRIMRLLDLNSKLQSERTCRKWRSLLLQVRPAPQLLLPGVPLLSLQTGMAKSQVRNQPLVWQFVTLSLVKPNPCTSGSPRDALCLLDLGARYMGRSTCQSY